MSYLLQFFDNSGEREIVDISTHDTIEQALEAAWLLGARRFWWDSCLLAGEDDISYLGIEGTVAIQNPDYFDSRFV